MSLLHGYRAWCPPVWLAALLTAACATANVPQDLAGAEDQEIATAVDREASTEAFAVCHGYGCGQRDLVWLDVAAHKALLSLFEPPPTDAAGERAAVARAVGQIEEVTGKALGTWADKPRTPISLNDPSQLDCVDESINTSTYLHLIHRLGLLRWHMPSHPARRYAFLGFGVHYTAVLKETATGRAYAVDSWFHGNGMAAEVVDLERWRGGWQPAGVEKSGQ